MNIRTISHPIIESRCQDENGHLNGEEVRFEETVSQVHNSFPVGALQSIRHNVGVNAVLDGLLGV